MSIVPPFLTPFSDVIWFFNFQRHLFVPGDKCTDMYLNYVDCMEAYGYEKGKYKCADYYFDLQECVSGQFQRSRAKAIQKERLKQYNEGKLEKPFEENPPVDSFSFK